MSARAIGISVTSVLLTQNTQIMHAQIAEQRHAVQPHAADRRRLPDVEHGDAAGLAALNAEVTRQAAIIAYVDDFKLMLLRLPADRCCCCSCGGRRPTYRTVA